MRRSRRRYALPDADLDRMVDELVERAARTYGENEGRDEVRQIMVSALRLWGDGTHRGDVRLVNHALKELRHAFRVFAPYRHQRKVAVFGSARTGEDEPEWLQAHEFAEQIVERGWMVITGAGDGIMGAAQGGAGRKRSFGVNIRLPFEQDANPVIAGDAKLINFRYFFTRKVTFVKEAHAIALFPGGFGTHDEGFEALTLIQTGKSEILPVVYVDVAGGSYWRDWEQYVHSHLLGRGLIGEQDLSLFRVTDDVDDAVHEICNFYSNYHSSRYRRDRLELRVRRAPDAAQLAALNDGFADLLDGGAIEMQPAVSVRDGTHELPCVTLRFNRRDIGRLRGLIDALNDLVSEDSSPPREASAHEIFEGEIPAEAEVAEDE